jgi:hypothetical protein
LGVGNFLLFGDQQTAGARLRPEPPVPLAVFDGVWAPGPPTSPIGGPRRAGRGFGKFVTPPSQKRNVATEIAGCNATRA